MPDIEIRAFEDKDLPTLQQIRRAAFRPIFRSFREMVGEEVYAVAFADAESEQSGILEGLCAPESGHLVFVGVLENRPVGFVTFTYNQAKRMGEIGLNAVHPEYAGHGIGSALYEFAMGWMKENGVAVVAVGTGGDISHMPARKAYRKAGFTVGIPSVSLYRVL